jgi:DNA helicase-2/ATP-dependent DNA helicase PcrA
LSGEHNVLFAVGDDDQSIYAFRGAEVGNMRALLTDFQVAEPVRLEQNYRSVGTILNAANALIERNDGRLGKICGPMPARANRSACTKPTPMAMKPSSSSTK